MLPSLEPLAVQLEMNTRVLLNAIGDMSPEQWLTRPGEGGNHAAFLSLHLLDARCFLLGLLGVSMTHGFEELGRDATRLEDIPEYPTVEEISRSWRRIGEGIPASLEAVEERRLREAAPHDFPVTDDTILGAVAFLAQHEAYHIGQLGSLRRFVGLEALSYS